ncbi:MAG TPA: DUF4173 domain-containing protein [Acidimicrobiales bacterium]|nr:DUF4173 domain-containing protein [Acidimicrobiales bacterium]
MTAPPVVPPPPAGPPPPPTGPGGPWGDPWLAPPAAADRPLLLDRGWSDVSDYVPPDLRVVGAVAAAAVATDLALRSGVIGVAGGLLAGVVVAGLLGGGRVPNRRAWPVLALAPAFGAFLAVRTSPWLLPLDVVAAAGLLVLGASLSREGDPLDLTVPGLAGRALHGLAHGMLAPGFLAAGLAALRRSRSNGRRRPGGDTGDAAPAGGGAAAVARGALLAAPVVCLLVLLLGSADPVFASFVRVPTAPVDLVVHALLLGVGAWGAAGLLRMASAAPFTVPVSPRRPLGAVEAITVMAGLVAVFAAFALSQLAAAVGGADYVRRTAGLSYADYARSGFFQLLAAAAVTLAVVLAVRASARLDTATHRLRFLVLGEAAVVLTLVVVGGAVRRLWLYEQAYGLTMLRLTSLLFALWIGAVFVLVALSLAGVGRSRAWLTPAALALALAGLLAVNAANPEAIVVRRNVERFAGSDQLDAWYLATLSDDAVPALLAAVPDLDAESAGIVLDRVCAGDRRAAGGFWAYNGSVAAAVEARRAHCPRE